MSDYDDDELPPISVNSVADCDSSTFIIPDADVLATQRAEEAAREEEIRRMRAENQISIAQRTDSSGSESEAGLAATLNQLKVTPAVPNASPPPDPSFLLASLVPCLPGDKEFVLNLQQCLDEAGDDRADVVFDSIVENICHLLQSDSTWSDEEIIQVCACLLCICVGEGSSRKVAGSALRQILDHIATEEQLKQLTTILTQSEVELPTLAVVRSLRGRAGGGGDRAATAIAEHALKKILNIGCDEQITPKSILSESSPWRTLSAREQHNAVLLLGRALRGDQGERGEILDSLAQVTAQCGDRNHPDRLRVIVGISKLQLLFRTPRH